MRPKIAATACALLLAAAGVFPAARAQEAEVPAPPANPNPLSTLTLDALSATRTLPLFTPSRSAPVVEQVVEAEPPPPEPEIVAEEPPPTPPPLKLIGVIMATAQEVALLSNDGSGEIVRIRPGEDFDGWKMKILDARSVEFSNGGQNHKLTMFEPGTEPPASERPPPPQAFEGIGQFGQEFGTSGEPIDDGNQDGDPAYEEPQGPQEDFGGADGSQGPEGIEPGEDGVSVGPEDGAFTPEGDAGNSGPLDGQDPTVQDGQYDGMVLPDL